MTKAERDFFEAARAWGANSIMWDSASEPDHMRVLRNEAQAVCVRMDKLYRAMIAEEEKGNALGDSARLEKDNLAPRLLGLEADREGVASLPVAEPKRGVEEILREALVANISPKRSAIYEWAFRAENRIREALHLYREERDGRK